MGDAVVLEYRPKVAVGLALSAVLVLTAGVLVWLGVILRPDDRAAMEGFTLLLFTAIPVRWFSWICAVLFVGLAYRVGRRALRSSPTLVISETELTLPNGQSVPWSRVRSVELTRSDLLRIRIVRQRSANSQEAARPGWLSRLLGRGDEDAVVLSAFDLGAAPDTVAKVLRERIGSG